MKKNKDDKNKEQELKESQKQVPELSIEEQQKEEIGQLNDKLLRLYSEFDNYKKRSVKERLDLLNMASEGVIKALLPVIDDFERALSLVGNEEDKKGIELIYNKLLTILKAQGLEVIETKDKIFDPDFAEAIVQFPTENEGQKGIVSDEAEKGYMLKGKVIRYAKVVVNV
ncbi:MAG: nucleotide exchange factor GrpE [Bacteroidales bacterium]|jgi:molecular chaperone GrpE|nr:nucleotide exchange factor GrpE [Bacteroidales bacterium]